MQLFAAQGVLIPFYHYPHYVDTQVEYLVKLKKEFPHVRMLTIINPSNGYVQKKEPNFAVAIEQLSKNGIETIGYIHTSYANRTLEEVKANVGRWVRHYKNHGISGIFIDEVNCSKSEYYKELAKRIRKDFRLVVANPGTRCKSDLNWSDIVVVHENNYYPKEKEGIRENEAILVYGVKDLNVTQMGKYDFVYVTEQNGSNPWEKLSSFLPEILRLSELEFQKGLNKNAVQLQVQSHE